MAALCVCVPQHDHNTTNSLEAGSFMVEVGKSEPGLIARRGRLVWFSTSFGSRWNSGLRLRLLGGCHLRALRSLRFSTRNRKYW